MDDAPNACPDCGHEFEDNITQSTRDRWEYTGTILALFVVASLPVTIMLAGLEILSVGSVSQGWSILYATVVLMAATWTFGKETLQAVREARAE